jgi:single-stranded DNA-binding protein
MLNLAVLVGTLSSPPEIRLLDSGSRLASLQVRVTEEGARTTSVPVTMWDPPSSVEALSAGDGVLVTGKVVRRFFPLRDGRRGSRTEVVAETVVPSTDRRKVAAALRRIRAALDGA